MAKRSAALNQYIQMNTPKDRLLSVKEGAKLREFAHLQFPDIYLNKFLVRWSARISHDHTETVWVPTIVGFIDIPLRASPDMIREFLSQLEIWDIPFDVPAIRFGAPVIFGVQYYECLLEEVPELLTYTYVAYRDAIDAGELYLLWKNRREDPLYFAAQDMFLEGFRAHTEFPEEADHPTLYITGKEGEVVKTIPNFVDIRRGSPEELITAWFLRHETEEERLQLAEEEQSNQENGE